MHRVVRAVPMIEHTATWLSTQRRVDASRRESGAQIADKQGGRLAVPDAGGKWPVSGHTRNTVSSRIAPERHARERCH